MKLLILASSNKPVRSSDWIGPSSRTEKPRVRGEHDCRLELRRSQGIGVDHMKAVLRRIAECPFVLARGERLAWRLVTGKVK